MQHRNDLAGLLLIINSACVCDGSLRWDAGQVIRPIVKSHQIGLNAFLQIRQIRILAEKWKGTTANAPPLAPGVT